jgi:hypothetical protein
VRAVAAAPIGLLDRALRGRGWVACIGLLLAGIVYLNVSLLEVNRDITTLGTRAAELNRENSILREKIAKEASSEQIQALAQRAGFVLPRPNEVRYLAANPDADAQVAAEAATPSAATTTGATPGAATPATDTPPTEDVPPAAAAEPTASAEPPPADDPG